MASAPGSILNEPVLATTRLTDFQRLRAKPGHDGVMLNRGSALMIVTLAAQRRPPERASTWSRYSPLSSAAVRRRMLPATVLPGKVDTTLLRPHLD
jgi:hypothetical protein